MQKMLYLRYQTTKPSLEDQTKAVMSISQIAKMLKVPYETLKSMHRIHFGAMKKVLGEKTSVKEE